MVGDFRKRTIWLACLMLVLSTTFALGQGIVTGSIAGTAVDPQKAVVVGAKVTARNTATGVEFKSTTNEQGYFSIRSVPIGTYRIALEAPNFKKLDVDGVVVNTGLTTDVGALTLALGATAETVTVEGAAPLIETTNAQGSGTFSSSATKELPMNGGFDQLALLLPGVVTAGGGGFTNNNGAQFGVNGQRDRSNNFQIDGQYNNDNSIAGPAIFVTNQDALQEVQVVTNNFGAEYGRNSGSVVNYVTKSGTNNFHGTGFEYYTGNWADTFDQTTKSPLLGFCAPGESSAATGCIPPTIARDTENRWGGSLGGPIIPNKMFFFTSFEQDTEKVAGGSVTSGTDTTPTPAGISTLATCFPGNTAVALLKSMGPFSYTSSNPVPINTTTTSVVGPGGVTCDGVDFGGVKISLPGIANDYEAVARVDIALTQKDQFFARYLFQQELDTGFLGAGAGEGSTEPGGSVSNVTDRGQQIALDWTRNWTSHIVNQVRFSYERTALVFGAGSSPSCTIFSPGVCPPTVELTGADELSFGYGFNLPQGRAVFNTQFQDNASWQHGRHLVKFGGEYVRQRSPSAFLPNYEGTYTFSSFTNFLDNSANILSLTSGNFNDTYKEQDTAMYIGDDWRFRDNLTLNLGVRWEYFQQAVNLLAANSLAQQTGPNPFWNTSLPLSVTTVPFIPNTFHNFAPRLGFAWTPHMFESILGHDKTVIRGGFSMAYDPSFYNMFLDMQVAAPLVNAGSVTPCTGCLPSAPTASAVRAQNLVLLPTGGNPGFDKNTRVTNNFHNPYAEEWTLGLQREINSKLAAEVRYVGSHTVGEFQAQNANPSLTGLLAFVAANPGAPNPIPAGITPCATSGTPGFAHNNINCDFNGVREWANGGFGFYNSLQTSLKFTGWHGFTSQVSYTYSKNIDNVSEIFGQISGGTGAVDAQNPFCPGQCEKGLSNLDFPNVFTVAWQYDVPYHGAKSGILGTALGGWAVAGTYKYNSGQVWQPLEFPGSGQYCDNNYDNTFYAGLVSPCRPFLANAAAPITAVGQCTSATAVDCGLVNFFTGAPTTFAAVRYIFNDNNSAGYFKTPYGNMGRNPPGFRGTPVNTVNFNLIKNTRMTEKLNLRLEANVYNLMNHPFYGPPDRYIQDGTFAVGGSFANHFFNEAGGGAPPFFSDATTNGIIQGLAQRRVILGAHLIF